MISQQTYHETYYNSQEAQKADGKEVSDSAIFDATSLVSEVDEFVNSH